MRANSGIYSLEVAGLALLLFQGEHYLGCLRRKEVALRPRKRARRCLTNPTKFLHQDLQSYRKKQSSKKSFLLVIAVRDPVSMFCSVNVVVYGSVMFAVIFLAIFLMVSLVAIKGLHWFRSGCDGSVMGIVSKSTDGTVVPLVRSLIQQFISLLTKPWVNLLKF